MGNLKKSTQTTMMKLTIVVLLLTAVFAQKVQKPKTDSLCALKLSTNGRCGPAFQNTRCAAGYCSKWNWCGTSKLHKNTQQAKFSARKCGKVIKKKVVKKAVKPKKLVKKLKIKVAKKAKKVSLKMKAKKAKKVVKKAKKAKKAKKVVKKAKKVVKKAAKKVVKKAKKAKKAKKV